MRSTRLGSRGSAACAVSAVAVLAVASGPAYAGTDGRAYELVSPAEKNGYPVFYEPQITAGLSALSRNGERAVFTSWGIFANAVNGMPQSYVANRTSRGWVTEVASPPTRTPRPNTLLGYNNFWTFATGDLALGLFETRDNLVSDDPDDTEDLYQNVPGQTPRLVSQGPNGEHVPLGARIDPGGQSEDGEHVLFVTDAHLVPEDAGRLAGVDVYERVGGQTRLVSVDSDERPLSTCGSAPAGHPQMRTMRNSISGDGSRVFFTTPDPTSGGFEPDCARPSRVFVRVGGADTVEVSLSQRRPADPAGPLPAVFEAAARDGSRVLFSSTELLTDEATTGGIYSYDVVEGSLRLVVASPGAGLIKASEDARTFYFASGDVLSPEAPAGQPNVYVYRNGTIRWVTASSELSAMALAPENARYAHITPDGSKFAFAVTEPLTGFDNRAPDGITLFSEVLVYDAVAATLRCVSCDVAAQRPASSVARSNASLTVSRGSQWVEPEPSFSADGQHLAFETGDQLVPEDTNQKIDVYEYFDGRVRLVSSGRSAENSYLVAMGATGRDVMFATYESLVGWDVDNGNQDMYVARAGGGFPEPERPRTTPCIGDSCQGAPTAPPVTDVPGSVGFGGDDGDVAGDIRTVRIVGATSGASGRLARGQAAGIVVRASHSGRLSLVARARIRGRSRVVARASTPARPGRITLRFRLSRAARAVARRQGLSIRVSVTLAGAENSDTATLRVRKPAVRGARR